MIPCIYSVFFPSSLKSRTVCLVLDNAVGVMVFIKMIIVTQLTLVIRNFLGVYYLTH